MKNYSLFALHLSSMPAPQGRASAVLKNTPMTQLYRCIFVCAAISLNFSTVAAAMPTNSTRDPEVAQALPTPVPPTPYASNPTAGGGQYLVIINGNSDLLLTEVRQIEPTAFVNFIEGSSVIQAGRFDSYQNAQNRTRELAGLGIGAQIKPVTPALPIAATPTVAAGAVQGNAGGNLTGDLPPIPIAATPSSAVEFGQAPPFPGASASAAAVPPAPSHLTLAPEAARASGYYVVVPSRARNLATVADQVVGLGAASSLVQTRQAPRGPHVAIGPYDSRDIAREWSNYLREAGLDARVYFE